MEVIAAVALRVPFEAFSRGFRNSQKLLEREIGAVVGDIMRLESVYSGPGGSVCASELDAALQRLEGQLLSLKAEVRVGCRLFALILPSAAAVR